MVSCNAYFAQLGTYDVGAEALWETADLLGIATAAPNTAKQLRKSLPQSAYGQGQVVASPFQMARVAATVANGGMMPYGRWVTDETNLRLKEPLAVLAPAPAALLGRFMREVVTAGTGGARAAPCCRWQARRARRNWRTRRRTPGSSAIAPYGGAARRIAFSILVENGQYGGAFAAPAAVELVNAAVKFGLAGAESQ